MLYSTECTKLYSNQQHVIKIIGFNSSNLTYHNIKNRNLPTCYCPPLWHKVNYDYWSHYIEWKIHPKVSSSNSTSQLIMAEVFRKDHKWGGLRSVLYQAHKNNPYFMSVASAYQEDRRQIFNYHPHLCALTYDWNTVL